MADPNETFYLSRAANIEIQAKVSFSPAQRHLINELIRQWCLEAEIKAVELTAKEIAEALELAGETRAATMIRGGRVTIVAEDRDV